MEDAIARLVEQNSFTDNPEGGRKVGAHAARALRASRARARVRPSERFADHLVFARAPRCPTRARRARRPPRHGLSAGHVRGVPPRRRPRARAGRARHEGRARRHRVRAEGARGDGRARRRRAGAASSSWRRGGGLAGRAGDHRRGHRRVARALVFEAGRKADAIITRRKGTGGMTASRTARPRTRATAQGRRERPLGARPLHRRRPGLTDYDRGVTVNVGRSPAGRRRTPCRTGPRRSSTSRFCTRADGERSSRVRARPPQRRPRPCPARVSSSRAGVARHAARADRGERARCCAEYGACAKRPGPRRGGGAAHRRRERREHVGVWASRSSTASGPRGTGFHTKDELIEVATLVPKAQALARFLAQRKSRAGRRAGSPGFARSRSPSGPGRPPGHVATMASVSDGVGRDDAPAPRVVGRRHRRPWWPAPVEPSSAEVRRPLRPHRRGALPLGFPRRTPERLAVIRPARRSSCSARIIAATPARPRR